MTTIYHNTKIDQRHRFRGIYVDISGCLETPVGPFQSRELATHWVTQNADRLIELYGPEAARIAAPHQDAERNGAAE